MWFGVLGALAARQDDGGHVSIPGPARRLLLAALISRVGETVTPSVLVEDLWGDTPPATAGKTLHSHVRRLRHDLSGSSDDRDWIVTEPGGYRLDLAAESIDAGCFEAALTAGLAALGSGDAKEALPRLDAALGWWRGVPYAEFPDAEFAIRERLHLTERHALAHEARIDAALLLGQGASLVADLEAQLLLDPYRERSWEQLMIALWRAGRQSDALAAFQRGRRTLVDDLGIEPGPGLRALEERILSHDESLLIPATYRTERIEAPVSRAGAVCPYQGLAAYDEQDAGLFVAREHAVARLVGLVDGGGVVVVTGPSGVGKSSLVRAGLIPALRSGALPGSSNWRCAVANAGDLANLSPPKVDVLVVDQAEEIFTVPPEREGRRVRQGVLAGMSASTVIMVVRADRYVDLAAMPEVSHRLLSAPLVVGSLTETELARVVTEPARRLGLDYEPELVDEILADVRGQPEALPMLSQALLRTWANRHGRWLTVEGYRAGGGVSGALEAAAEEVYLDLDEQTRDDVRRLLLRMATFDAGMWSRRPVLTEQLGSLGIHRLDETVTLLADRRLVTVTEKRVELIHEALLTRWPRLRSWLDARAAMAPAAERLADASRAWADTDRPESDLYRGLRLQEALAWQASGGADLSPVETEFLAASRAASDEEIRRAEAQVVADARSRRRLRNAVAGLTAFAVLALTGLGVALHERAVAQQDALVSEASALASLSHTVPDVRTSLLLAVAGYRLNDDADTRSALLSAVESASSIRWRIPTPVGPDDLVANTNGHLWLTHQSAGINEYDAGSRRLVAELPSVAPTLDAVSPDGRTLVVSGPASFPATTTTGRVDILNAHTGAVITELHIHGTQRRVGTWSSAAFTGDGRWLAVIVGRPSHDLLGGALQPSRTVAVFDTSDYSRPPHVLRVDAPITQLAAGTSALAIGTATGHLMEFTLRDDAAGFRAISSRVAEHSSGRGPFSLSPDGRYIATTAPGRPRLVRVISASPPNRVADSFALSAKVTDVAFSPGGDRVAAVAPGVKLAIDAVPTGTVERLAIPSRPGDHETLAWSGTPTHPALYLTDPANEIVSINLDDTAVVVHRSRVAAPQGEVSFMAGSHVITVTTLGEPGLAPPRLIESDPLTRTSTSYPIAIPKRDVIAALTVDRSVDRVLLQYVGPNSVIHSAVLSLPSDRVVSRFLATPRPSAHYSYTGVISEDGTQAVCAVGDHRIAVISLPSGRVVRSFDIHFSGPAGLHTLPMPMFYDPNGDVVVAGYNPTPPASSHGGPSADRTAPPPVQSLGLVDPRTGRLVGQTHLGVQGVVSAAAWSPDGQRVVVGTWAGNLRLLDAQTLHPMSPMVSTDGGPVSTLSFSPDNGSVLSTGATER